MKFHSIFLWVGIIPNLLFCSISSAQTYQQVAEDSIMAQKLFAEAWGVKFRNPDSTIVLSQKGMALTKFNKSMQILGLRNISVAYSIKGSLDSAEHYGKKTLEKAYELNNQIAIASAYQNLGIVASQKGNNKKAIEYYQQIVKIAEQTGDSSLVMRNLSNMGLSYYKLGDYKNSIAHLMRGLRIAEAAKDTASLINCCKNLSNAHFELGNLDISLDYSLKTYAIASKKNDIRGIKLASNTLGNIYKRKKDYESALKYFYIALNSAKEMDDKDSEAVALHCIGNVLSLKGEYTQGEDFFRKSLVLKKEIGDNSSIARTYNSLTELNISIGNLVKAQIAIDSALHYSKTVEDRALTNDILESQSSLAQKSGDLMAALKYSNSLMMAKDSIYSAELTRQIAELETQYKTAQKQQQIELQEAQIANQQLEIKQTRLIIFLIASLSTIIFTLASIAFYIFRKRKKEQLVLAKINEQLAVEKYQNLYRETQLKAIQEKIAGQEEERTRIARELHDGVGGNLVALRLQLEQSMKNPNPEDVSSLFSMVTSTLEEVRSISQNLMPPVFDHIAIDQVLNVYIGELNRSGKIRFSIQFLPNSGWEKTPSNLQVELYRIIQELCSNIVKYSDATEVALQLSLIDNSISMIMEDNGKAFDYTGTGIGYRNINERLRIINGVFEKAHCDRTGNTYHIYIPLEALTV